MCAMFAALNVYKFPIVAHIKHNFVYNKSLKCNKIYMADIIIVYSSSCAIGMTYDRQV